MLLDMYGEANNLREITVFPAVGDHPQDKVYFSIIDSRDPDYPRNRLKIDTRPACCATEQLDRRQPKPEAVCLPCSTRIPTARLGTNVGN